MGRCIRNCRPLLFRLLASLLSPHLLIPPPSPAFLSSVSLLSSLPSFSLTPSFLPPPLSFLIPPPLPLLPAPPSPYSLLSCLFSFRSPLPPPPYILLPSTLYPAPRKLFLFISSPAPYTLPQVSLASAIQPISTSPEPFAQHRPLHLWWRRGFLTRCPSSGATLRTSMLLYIASDLYHTQSFTRQLLPGIVGTHKASS